MIDTQENRNLTVFVEMFYESWKFSGWKIRGVVNEMFVDEIFSCEGQFLGLGSLENIRFNFKLDLL